jgi:5-dehydro-2-deoxygluconokinase
MTAFDVVTMGRIGIDLYPEQSGVPLAEVTSFRRFLGGSPTNVAVGAARLGRSSAVVTRVGSDGFGDFAIAALEGYGVSAEWVGRDPVLHTPIAFAELFPPDHFPLTFYREPAAPDSLISREDLDLGAIAAAGILWVSGGSLATEPARGAVVAAVTARSGASTVLDLDYRPALWPDPGVMRAAVADLLPRVRVVVGNESEFSAAFGQEDPSAAVEAALAHGVELAVLKRGPLGVSLFCADGSRSHVDPIEVDVVCGLGAGDAFGAALCHGLLSGWTGDRLAAFANAAGAIVASRLACSDAMPTVSEVEDLLARVARAAKGSAG